MVAPTSEVYWTVVQGPKSLALVQGSVSVTISPNNTKQVAYHTMELFVKST